MLRQVRRRILPVRICSIVFFGGLFRSLRCRFGFVHSLDGVGPRAHGIAALKQQIPRKCALQLLLQIADDGFHMKTVRHQPVGDQQLAVFLHLMAEHSGIRQRIHACRRYSPHVDARRINELVFLQIVQREVRQGVLAVALFHRQQPKPVLEILVIPGKI